MTQSASQRTIQYKSTNKKNRVNCYLKIQLKKEGEGIPQSRSFIAGLGERKLVQVQGLKGAAMEPTAEKCNQEPVH